MRLKLPLLLSFLFIPLFGFAKDNDRFARIILFTPSEAEPPEDFKVRLGSLAIKTEAIFSKSFVQWERSVERKEIFARSDDGTVKVTLVKGNLLKAKGMAALPELRKKAIAGATKQLGLKAGDASVIWWIFYNYPEVKGFQGGARGSSGVAINAYPKGDDPIGIETELAEGSLADMSIKGTIHEFGHALGLPHIGPRPGLKLGNSLMGPINKVFWRRSGTSDVRVYINEASIAALWKHPIFRKEVTPSPKAPAKIAVVNLDVTEAKDGKSIVIKGKLLARNPAHSVIALDSEPGRYGDYWARSYVAGIDSNTGTFEISVTEPFKKGTLFLAFAFDNGLTTSDGKRSFQQGSSIEIPYTTIKGRREFQR